MREFSAAVVIPLYNKAPYIRATLQSVLSQELPAAEIVIVDDGSTDGGSDAITDLLSPQVRLIRQSNSGPGPTRNRGSAETTSDWIAFIDGDDLWHSSHLSTIASLNQAYPNANVLATGYQRQPVGSPPRWPLTHGQQAGEVFNFFNPANEPGSLWTSSVAVRRKSFFEAGGFGDFCPGEDMDLWVRLALDNIIVRTAAITAMYLTGTGGIIETMESRRPAEFLLSPIFLTLDAAAENPDYLARRDEILSYKGKLLQQMIRQAIYLGRPAASRELIKELSKMGQRVAPVLRLGSLIPSSVLLLAGRVWKAAKYRD